MRRRLFTVAVVTATGFGLGGCGGCRRDADCGYNQHCAFEAESNQPGTCSPGCRSDLSCAADQSCSSGQCTRIPGCHSDSECNSGSVCSASRVCERKCNHLADPPCDPGSVCVPGDGARADTCRPGCTDNVDCSASSYCRPDPGGAAQCAPGCREDAGCSPGAWCQQGSCVLSKFVGLALDAKRVYYATEGANSGVVGSLPKSGGAATILASGLIRAYAVAVDGTSVYWTSSGAGPDFHVAAMSGAVMKAPLAGGNATTLASGLACPSALTVDGTSIYWVDGDRLMNAPVEGGPSRVLARWTSPFVEPCGTSGGPPLPVVPNGIAVDRTSVYFTTGITPLAFGAAPSGVSGMVMKVPLGGGDPVALASGLTSPTSVVIDGTSVYWVDRDRRSLRGNLMRAPLSGGSASTILSQPCSPFGLALDTADVYFTSVCGDELLGRVPTSGGYAELFTENPDHVTPGAIATDATSVYWTDWSLLEARVMKIAKASGASSVLASTP